MCIYVCLSVCQTLSASWSIYKYMYIFAYFVVCIWEIYVLFLLLLMMMIFCSFLRICVFSSPHIQIFVLQGHLYCFYYYYSMSMALCYILATFFLFTLSLIVLCLFFFVAVLNVWDNFRLETLRWFQWKRDF